MLMDQVDTWHVGRYWSEVLSCTIKTNWGDQGHGLRNFTSKFLLKVLRTVYCVKVFGSSFYKSIPPE